MIHRCDGPDPMKTRYTTLATVTNRLELRGLHMLALLMR